LVRQAYLTEGLFVFPLLENGMSRDEIINWIVEIAPWMASEDDETILDVYETYRQYRDDGQSHEISKQYAGLL
jgi:hypothetical protein